MMQPLKINVQLLARSRRTPAAGRHAFGSSVGLHQLKFDDTGCAGHWNNDAWRLHDHFVAVASQEVDSISVEDRLTGRSVNMSS